MSKKKDRSTSDSILRLMLNAFSKGELIETLIEMINSICTTEEEIEKMRHFIIVYVHAKKVFFGKSKLENYEEPHRTEVRKEVEKLETQMYRTRGR